MKSEFNLIRSAEGRLNFARVCVFAVGSCDGNIEISDETPVSVDHRSGEVNLASHPEWIAAAMQGASRTAEFIVRTRRAIGCRVELLSVIGSAVDTMPATVECAAAQAVWKAICGDEGELQMDYDTMWRVLYPES